MELGRASCCAMLLLCIILTAMRNVSSQAYKSTYSHQLQKELAAALNVEAAVLFDSDDTWHSRFTVEQQLLGPGFHRTVEYRMQYLAPSAQELQECRVSLLQLLPSSVYADPYQLKDIARAARDKAISHASGQARNSAVASHTTPFEFLLLGPLDLEQPAPACEPTALLLHFNMTEQQPSSSATALLSVPLHAKYPEPLSFSYQGWQAITTGHVGVVLPPPSLLVDCRLAGGQLQLLKSAKDPLQHQQCTASSKAGSTVEAAAAADCADRLQHQQLVWSVPAGNLDHLQLVSWGTLLVTAVCCAALSFKAVQLAVKGV